MNMMGFRSIGMARGGVVQPNNVVRGNVARPGGVPGGSEFMGASSPLMQLFRDYYVAPDKTAAQVPAQAPAQAPAPVARNAPVDSGALYRFRREFGREPRDTAELQEYMISGGGAVTPMRDGGMMGFRPVGYEQGGPVAPGQGRNAAQEGVQLLVNELVSVMRDGTPSDVRGYVNMNRPSLEAIAGMDIGPANIVRNVLSQFPLESPPREQMPQEQQMPQMPDLGPGFDPQTGDFFPPQARASGGIMSLRR